MNSPKGILTGSFLAMILWLGQLHATVPDSASRQLQAAADLRKQGKHADAANLLRSVLTEANSAETIAWAARELASAVKAAAPGESSALEECLALYTKSAENFDQANLPTDAVLALLDGADMALRENCKLPQAEALHAQVELRCNAADATTKLAVCLPAYWQYQGRRRLSQGQFQAAAEAFSDGRKALALSPALAASERSQADAKLNASRALALWRAGQRAESKAAFQQSLQVLEQLPALTGIDLLEPRQNFALALLSWGEPTEAAQRLQSAIAAAVEAKSEAAPLVAPRLNLGIAELASDHAKSALDVLETAWQDVQKHQVAGRRLRMEVATYRWLAMRQTDKPVETQRAAARMAADESTAWMQQILSKTSNEALTAQRRWEDPLAAILSTELLEEPLGVNQAATAMLNVHGAVFESEFLNNAPAPPISLESMQNALPKGSCYLQITSHLTPAKLGQWEDTCSSLILRPTQSPAIIPGPHQLKDWLQALANDWNQALTNTNTNQKELVELLQDCHELLWEPFLALFPAELPETIYLCVDGPLSAVPWPCLMNKTNNVLLENKSTRLVFLSSPHALLRMAKSPPATLIDRPWLVVDAAVEKNSLSASVFNHPKHFPYSQLPLQLLPGAREEAVAVAKHAKSATLLSQATATETNLRQSLEKLSPVVLHYAGHGTVDEKADGDSVQSRFWEGADNPAGFSQIGLLFPNFGKSDLPTTADDWLSAAEIAKLPLGSVQLAVFSSCQGGRGLASSGEGRFDLARAAQIAGVRDVLVAAGPVWDKSAVHMMQDLYQQISKGADPATAAWDAQKRLWIQSKTSSLTLAIRQAGPYRLIRNR